MKICHDKNVCNASFSVRLITGDAQWPNQRKLHIYTVRYVQTDISTVLLLYVYCTKTNFHHHCGPLMLARLGGASASNAVLQQLTRSNEFPVWNYKQMQIQHVDWLRFVWLVWAVAVIFICEGKAVSHLHIALTSSPIFQKAASQDSFGQFQQLDGCRTDSLCSSHPSTGADVFEEIFRTSLKQLKWTTVLPGHQFVSVANMTWLNLPLVWLTRRWLSHLEARLRSSSSRNERFVTTWTKSCSWLS